jgi:hypothetical protein
MQRAILVGGLTAGVLDISAAVAQNALRGVPPARILQSVAAGLLGRAAYAGGASTALLGLALHFGIACTAAAVYYAASRRMPFLLRRAVLAGMLYGIAVFFVMNRIVLPLSRFPGGQAGFNLATALPQIAIHMVCVGLPIALAVRHYAGVTDRSIAHLHRRSGRA